MWLEREIVVVGLSSPRVTVFVYTVHTKGVYSMLLGTGFPESTTDHIILCFLHTLQSRVVILFVIHV